MFQRVVGGSLDPLHLETRPAAAKGEAQDLRAFCIQADVSSES
jgi:hypothetical protein